MSRIINIFTIAARFVPAAIWLAGAIRDAVTDESEAGKHLSPAELADLMEGFVQRIEGPIRSIGGA